MARFYPIFIFAFLLSATASQAAIKNWVGLDGDNWNNSTSWSPVGIPVSTDDVVINNFVGTINVNTSLTIIRSLTINGGSDVTFSGNANNRNILISCASCSSEIEAGSNATFTGESTFNFACDLYVSSCQSFTIDGNLTFTGGVSSDFYIAGGNISINGDIAFSGSGNSHLACAGGVTTVNGSVVYSGGGETTATSPSVLVINAGGSYEIAKNGGTLPNITWNNTSNLVISGMVDNDPDFGNVASNLGIMSWDCPLQNAPANLNKDLTFNQVYIYDTGSSEIRVNTQSGAGQMRTWTVNGDYTQSGGVVNLTSGNNGSGKINFKGSSFYAAMTLTETASNAGRGIVEFSGTQPQTAYFGVLLNTIDVVINTFDRVLLNTQLSLNSGANLYLTNGHLITSAQNLLTLGAGSSVIGGSLSSYVKGPMRKAGNTAFTFPIGKTNTFAPGAISAPAAVTDTFTAEYYDDPYVNTLDFVAPLVRVSLVEHWQLARKSGASPVQVTLSWVNGTFSGINDLLSLTVARFDGTNWVNTGGTATGTTTAGSIQSDAITLFDWFTFGAKAGGFNPLPIELKTFTATARREQVDLEWITASEKNNAYFGVERSADGLLFSEIGRKTGAGTSFDDNTYTFSDLAPMTGLNYYRLRQVDLDGQFTYSPVRVVQIGQTGRLLLFPSPAVDILQIRLPEALEQAADWQILDQSGRVVARGQWVDDSLETQVPIGHLPEGTYRFLLFTGREPLVETFCRANF
ncbi:MAG: hypothetical protein IT260_07480 [Saprospiraceae bacterium]|nr:hypothetical protein [Saprospiraceae bacterium]